MELAPLDLSDPAVAAEVLDLQRRAYRVEAQLIGTDEIPPLRETLAGLQACGETFLGARVDGTLAGAVSWRVDGETLPKRGLRAARRDRARARPPRRALLQGAALAGVATADGGTNVPAVGERARRRP